MPKKIKDRYIREARSAREKILPPKTVESTRFPYTPDTDPKSVRFMIGLYLSLEPTEYVEQELFQGGETLICD